MGQMWIHITMLFAVIVLASFFLKRIRLIGEEYNMVTIGDFTALKYGEAARIPTAISFLFAYCSMTGMQFVAIASILNLDRKSTRLNSSHVSISYAVFCLIKDTHSKHAV